MHHKDMIFRRKQRDKFTFLAFVKKTNILFEETLRDLHMELQRAGTEQFLILGEVSLILNVEQGFELHSQQNDKFAVNEKLRAGP